MPTTPRSSRRRSQPALDLPALLAELEASGLSAAAFARRRGVLVWKLYRARRAAKRSRPHRKDMLIPVRIVDAASSAPSPLELKLPSGLHLLVPADFDEASLRRLLGVLASC